MILLQVTSAIAPEKSSGKTIVLDSLFIIEIDFAEFGKISKCILNSFFSDDIEIKSTSLPNEDEIIKSDLNLIQTIVSLKHHLNKI